MAAVEAPYLPKTKEEKRHCFYLQNSAGLSLSKPLTHFEFKTPEVLSHFKPTCHLKVKARGITMCL